MLLFLLALQVAGLDGPYPGGAAGHVLGLLRVAVLGGLLAAVVFIAAAFAHARLGKAGVFRAVPRPRWQYLLAAAGWLGISGGLAFTGMHGAGTGLVYRVCGATALWTGAYGLVLIGRAAFWGRPRALLWWVSSPTS